jgi:glycosyltransferase involved in cell wall biosynthesis
MKTRRALVASFHPPEPDHDSGSRRLHDLMGLLQADGWRLTFVATRGPGEGRGRRLLQQRGVAVFDGSELRLEDLLTVLRFDLALLAYWPVAETLLPAIRRLSPDTRVLVDSVDLSFLRNSRRIFRDAYDQGHVGVLDKKLGAEWIRELNVYAAADAVLTVSQKEADLVNDLAGEPALARVVPDLEWPAASFKPFRARRGILFLGSFGHQPNVGAVEFLCQQVLPLLPPGLTARHPVYIVGDKLDENVRRLGAGLPQVWMVGWVPSVRPYLERVRLTVVPVRYGAGTKRKLLQSLLAGTPAVSTSVGVEGFGLRHGHHVLVADDPAHFATAITRLLRDMALWKRLAHRGRAHLLAQHGPDAVRDRLRATLEAVLAAKPKAGLPGAGGDHTEPARLDAQQYRQLQEAIRQQVEAVLPKAATVLVVSRGDDALLKLGSCTAWHFPQTPEGLYAGYHPADSAAAIAHLEALRAKGGQYLLFPQTAFWWLDHYHGLKEHLDNRYVQAWRDEQCVLYKLVPSGGRGPVVPPQRSHSGTPSVETGALPPAEAAPDRGGGTRLAPAARSPALSSASVPGGTPAVSFPDVVCLPIIDWGFRFQRPQQLMSRFAAAGHRVFYVSQVFRASGRPCRTRRLATRLYEVSLRGPGLNVYEDALHSEACEQLRRGLETLRLQQSLQAAVALVQLPFWWPLARQAAIAFAWPVVYDCMDHHAGFSTNHRRMLRQEREMLRRADLVVTSSAVLQAKARRYNRNVLLLRNGCDYVHFAKGALQPRPGRPVIGYFGAIAEWFDTELVAELAERRPDWDFVLVGSTFGADPSRLSKLPNVSLPGEQTYAEIPAWLARFHVTILPFKRTALTRATNPVKAYEILASGKPLVSVPLPEVARLAPLVRLASTVAQFEHQIELELSRPDPALAARRQSFARENTWEKRYEELAPAILQVVAETLGGSPNHSAPLRRHAS